MESPVASNPPSRTTAQMTAATLASRFRRWYLVALSSFTLGFGSFGAARAELVESRFGRVGLLGLGAARPHADAAVGGLQLDRRAAAVHAPFEAPARSL